MQTRTSRFAASRLFPVVLALLLVLIGSPPPASVWAGGSPVPSASQYHLTFQNTPSAAGCTAVFFSDGNVASLQPGSIVSCVANEERQENATVPLTVSQGSTVILRGSVVLKPQSGAVYLPNQTSEPRFAYSVELRDGCYGSNGKFWKIVLVRDQQ